MNTRKQGDIGLSEAIAYYTKLGYVVSVPLTEATKYDLLIDDGDSIKRVQCKTSSYTQTEGRSFQVNLATSGGNQSWTGIISTIDKDLCDLVFIWCSDDSIWEIPSEEVHGKSSVTVGYHNQKYQLRGPIRAPKGGRTSKHIYVNGDPKDTCPDCGGIKSITSVSCRKCYAVNRIGKGTKIDWPDIDTVLAMVEEMGYSKTGRSLGVSDNAVKKFLSKRIHTTK